ncbi:HET-domain-containing protein [Stipitochalara longipes BDJ]|nr:HET-domain-containing protein [Stipitochalara longipes BDJ]
MRTVYVPQKRKIESVPSHGGNSINQPGRFDEALQTRRPFGESEADEENQEIYADGRDGQASPWTANSRSGDRDTPKPTKNGYPSASQGQHLCESCSSIDFNKIQPEPGIWKKTALKLGTLSQFTVDPDCLLCQLFASMASLAYAPNTSDSMTVDDITFYLCSFYTSAMYSHNWRNSRTIRGLQKSVSFAIIDEHVFHDRDDSFTKERKMSHALWPSRTSIERSGWLSPVQKAREERGFAALTLKSQTDMDSVKRWLDFCLKNHGETCEPIDMRPIPNLRVVDCTTGLIIPAEPGCKYLAMSYVWGSVPSKELENGENLFSENTPILIRDALSATKLIGYRYLWIDRYCIPQEDGKERHSQIQQMDLVYSKAQSTIIAISSPDPSHGLPGIGGRKRATPVTINISNELHAYVPPHPSAEIYGSVWNSRGWTHQETILSRRRIFFCKQQIYFECSGMRCHDTMNAPLELLHTKELRTFSKWNRPGLFSRVRQTKDPFSAVFDHIALYTRRNLTRPEDILNGIMGTFHAFESIYDSFRHYLGIPMVPDITYNSVHDPNPRKSTRTEQFLTGLCWYPSGSWKRRSGFPSWSWAGWYGTMKPHSEGHGYIENRYGVKIWIDSIFTAQMDLKTFCDTTAMDIDVFPKNPDPYMYIEADFFQVRLRLARRTPGREANTESKWEAVFETANGEPMYATCHLTKHTSAGDEFYTRILNSPWSVFILGDRLKTRTHAATKRKILSNESPHAILVVVDELEKDMIERVGIIELDKPEDRVRLEGISKHRCVRKYG